MIADLQKSGNKSTVIDYQKKEINKPEENRLIQTKNVS